MQLWLNGSGHRYRTHMLAEQVKTMSTRAPRSKKQFLDFSENMKFTEWRSRGRTRQEQQARQGITIEV
jgi:hypothetical protein